MEKPNISDAIIDILHMASRCQVQIYEMKIAEETFLQLKAESGLPKDKLIVWFNGPTNQVEITGKEKA